MKFEMGEESPDGKTRKYFFEYKKMNSKYLK